MLYSRASASGTSSSTSSDNRTSWSYCTCLLFWPRLAASVDTRPWSTTWSAVTKCIPSSHSWWISLFRVCSSLQAFACLSSCLSCIHTYSAGPFTYTSRETTTSITLRDWRKLRNNNSKLVKGSPSLNTPFTHSWSLSVYIQLPRWAWYIHRAHTVMFHRLKFQHMSSSRHKRIRLVYRPTAFSIWKQCSLSLESSFWLTDSSCTLPYFSLLALWTIWASRMLLCMWRDPAQWRMKRSALR